jgi:recombinational DNA repair protein (RecF pathway)
MAYKTYITEAIVCGSKPSLTSDRSYLLFTREAGMLYAVAKSVREERSKQRFALQEFSYIRVTLVHGKGGWRVTGAEAIKNLYAQETTREARGLLRNTLLLTRRLIQGEIAHPDIFDDLVDLFSTPILTNALPLEHIFTYRTLHTLGYIAPEVSLTRFLEGRSLRILGEVMAKEEVEMIARATHRALTESHL